MKYLLIPAIILLSGCTATGSVNQGVMDVGKKLCESVDAEIQSVSTEYHFPKFKPGIRVWCGRENGKSINIYMEFSK